MKYPRIALLVFFFLCAGESFAQVSGKIFGIHAKSLTGVKVGTGFLVGHDGIIVTAYHLVYGASAVDIQDGFKGLINVEGVKILAINTQNDLALIHVPSLVGQKGFQLSEKSPSVREVLQVVGYPNGMPNATVEARAISEPRLPSQSAFRNNKGPILNDTTKVIPLDMTIYGGLSGAPLLDSSQRVFGVISGSLNEGGSFAWAIPSEAVRSLIAKSNLPQDMRDYKWPRLELLSRHAQPTVLKNSSKQSKEVALRNFQSSINEYKNIDAELNESLMLVEYAYEACDAWHTPNGDSNSTPSRKNSEHDFKAGVGLLENSKKSIEKLRRLRVAIVPVLAQFLDLAVERSDLQEVVEFREAIDYDIDTSHPEISRNVARYLEFVKSNRSDREYTAAESEQFHQACKVAFKSVAVYSERPLISPALDKGELNRFRRLNEFITSIDLQELKFLAESAIF